MERTPDPTAQKWKAPCWTGSLWGASPGGARSRTNRGVASPRNHLQLPLLQERECAGTPCKATNQYSVNPPSYSGIRHLRSSGSSGRKCFAGRTPGLGLH